LCYNETHGPERFRKILAKFLNRYVQPIDVIDAEDVHVLGGAGSCIEMLGQALMDPGDGVIIPEPYYACFDHELTRISQAEVFTIPITKTTENDKIRYILSRCELNKALEAAKSKGVKIKSLLLTNPHNPTGCIFDKDSVAACMDFCDDEGIHFISDEVYMASAYNGHFQSALNIRNQQASTHMIWSFSKDFGMCGFRAGCIITKHPMLKKYLREQLNQRVPTILTYILEPVLTDFQWLENTYFPTNHQRLKSRASYLKSELEKASAGVSEPAGGLFAWCDFNKHMPQPATEEDEMELFERLMDAGVYIVPGSVFHSSEMGWFRIVISGGSDQTFQMAVGRIRKTLIQHNKKEGA